MEMPRPGAAHARLQVLTGRWVGDETLHPTPWDPAGGRAAGVVENRVALDGFAVVQEYQQSRDGRPNFSGHGVFWWDAATGQYVMTWVDSMAGMAAEYRGDFDGATLRLVTALAGGGFARCSFDHGTPDRYTFLMEMSPDGHAWAPFLEGTYTRHRPAARRAAPARPKAKAKPAAKAVKRSAPKARAAGKPRTRAKAPRPVAAPRRAAARRGPRRGGRRR